MSHGIHRVVDFEQLGEFTLRVAFDDGSVQEIDFAPMLQGELYGPLADPTVFAGVSLDTEAHTLVWPNGADFDPATLHDWPSVSAAMVELAKSWASVPS